MKLPFIRPTFYWDFGTAHSRLYSVAEGLIADIPSVIIRQTKGNKVIALGEEADSLRERLPSGFELIDLVVSGRIADPNLYRLMDFMLGDRMDGLSQKLIPHPAVVTVGAGYNPAHRRALVRAAVHSGFGSLEFVPQAVATLASLNPERLNAGGLVLDLGAGRVEISLISGGSVLAETTIASGGEELDQRIQAFLEDQLELEITLAKTTRLKTAFSLNKRKAKPVFVFGRSHKTGRIESVALEPAEIETVIRRYLSEVLTEVIAFINGLPAGVAPILSEQGILLSGGMSQMEGIADWFADGTRLPVASIARPAIAPLLGAVKLLGEERYSYLVSSE